MALVRKAAWPTVTLMFFWKEVVSGCCLCLTITALLLAGLPAERSDQLASLPVEEETQRHVQIGLGTEDNTFNGIECMI